MYPLLLSNVGSPVINVAVAPITQLNIAVLSSAPQLNAATALLGGFGRQRRGRPSSYRAIVRRPPRDVAGADAGVFP